MQGDTVLHQPQGWQCRFVRQSSDYRSWICNYH
jgi:hypothetical protein